MKICWGNIKTLFSFWTSPPARERRGGVLRFRFWAPVMTVQGFAERWDEGYKFNLGVSADQWQQSNLDLRLWIPEQMFHVTHTDDTSGTTLRERNPPLGSVQRESGEVLISLLKFRFVAVTRLFQMQSKGRPLTPPLLNSWRTKCCNERWVPWT